jgi:hypothetical protein
LSRLDSLLPEADSINGRCTNYGGVCLSAL